MNRFSYISLIVALLCCRPAVCFADAVLDWNEIALTQVTSGQQLPPDGSRSMAMLHVAMFDAINAIEARYAAYAFHDPAPRVASPEAAAASAARTVLLDLFENGAQAIEAAYAEALKRIPDGEAKSAGVAIGQSAAAACLARRADDGSTAPNTYKPRTTPGTYVPTTLPVSFQWGAVRPWMLKRGEELRPRSPVELTSAEWVRDYNEIKALGARQSTARTAEQTETARFWMTTGPAAWNPVVRSVALSARLDLLDNARLFALVGMATMDAYVASFEAKYFYGFWRPITAIRNGDSDNNPATDRDLAWLPLIDTPMHPEYPCAHCITASAVGAVLEAHFGRGRVAPISMTSPTAPGVTHRWTRIADYVAEVSNARVWGGVHYRSSTEIGEAMGRQIGQLAVQHLLTAQGGSRPPRRAAAQPAATP